MNNLSDKSSDNETHLEGKKFRLVVRSAEEAVRVIRDKLGDDAKVLSVRQLGGEGLKRFISSPKLEVIAEVPAEEPTTIPQQHETSSPHKSEVKPNSSLSDPEMPKSVSKDEEDGVHSYDDNLVLLKRSGFDPILLRDIQSWKQWDEIKNKPFADVLKEITIGLSDRFRSAEEKPTTNRIALLGCPGVGKTTTLCKFLAHEVFMNKSIPSVLKVENGIPNPDDALRIFCEVIGVTLFREADSLPASSHENPLYLDFPGLAMNDLNGWAEAGHLLDSLNVETRVLIVNGAYERDIIQKEIQMARHLKATHIAVTHFDEITNSTKLWPLFLNSSLSPLCICNGQNVTGDFSTNVLNQMISRTFPEELYSRGFSSYKKVIS